MPELLIRQKRRIEASPNTPGANAPQAGSSLATSPILIEATLSEAHVQNVEVTSHPVEDGLDVSDYVRTGPIGLRIEAAFSNQPFHTDDRPDGIFAGSNETRISAAWDAFLDIVNGRPRRELLTISTGLKLYDNMLITSIGTSQTEDNPESIVIRLTLKEVRIVRSASTLVPARLLQAGETQQRGSPEVSLGDQIAAEVADCTDIGSLCDRYCANPDYVEAVDGPNGTANPEDRVPEFIDAAQCEEQLEEGVFVGSNAAAREAIGSGERTNRKIEEQLQDTLVWDRDLPPELLARPVLADLTG